MLIELLRFVGSRSKSTILFVALTSILLVGYGDFVTGTEINFTLLYLIPVTILAWTISLGAAVFTSLLTALVWAAVDYLGRSEVKPLVMLWNIGVQSAIFVAFAYALSQIRSGMSRQDRLNADLQSALAEVKRLSGLLPICAWCKRIRETEEIWVPIERYVATHSEVDFTHSICPDCAGKMR